MRLYSVSYIRLVRTYTQDLGEELKWETLYKNSKQNIAEILTSLARTKESAKMFVTDHLLKHEAAIQALIDFLTTLNYAKTQPERLHLEILVAKEHKYVFTIHMEEEDNE